MPRQKRSDGLDRVGQMQAFRKTRKEQRRFESPLKDFIEIKYKNIFDEYVDLYRKMNDENPTKNDLRKSETFKKWKKEQLDTDTLSQAIRETIGDDGTYGTNGSETSSNSETREYNANNSDSNNNNNNSDNESPETQDHMLAAQQIDSDNESPESHDHMLAAQQIDSDNESPESQDHMLATQQIDAIVNEMINDDVLRELFNAEDPQDEDPQDDEGIELNPWDEIDIEPFDFQLEVELGM